MTKSWTPTSVFLTAFLLSVPDTIADENRLLTGSEIKNLLSGNTAIAVNAGARPWRQIFNRDGSTSYYSGSRPESPGHWEIRENQYCSLWPPSDQWACYDVIVKPSAQDEAIIGWDAGAGAADFSAIYPGDRTFGDLPADHPH